MKARANTDSKFLYKYLLIGIATLLYSIYCYYDAFYNYPQFELPRSQAFDQLKEDIENRQKTADPNTNWGEIRAKEWDALTAENGWTVGEPHNTADDVRSNINFSIALGVLCTAIAIPCIIWFFRTKGTWMEIDGSQISHSDGTKFDISQITRLDKKKWEKKGIAVAHYSDSDNTEQTFTIDDLKYERAVVDQMMVEIESVLPADKIVNGPTEAELAEKRAAAQAARQARLKELEADETD